MGKERVEIFCDGNAATIEDFKSGSVIINGRKTPLGGGTQDKGHAAEIAAFLDAVRRRDEAPIDLESLTATTLATFAAVESARNGTAIRIDLNSVFSG